jgi:hypothetical protein
MKIIYFFFIALSFRIKKKVMFYDNVGDIGRPLVSFQGRITENVGAALVAAQEY